MKEKFKVLGLHFVYYNLENLFLFVFSLVPGPVPLVTMIPIYRVESHVKRSDEDGI